MSALRLVKREFRARFWYSLVRLDDDRVAMGGLRSPTEADQWAADNGHTIVDSPGRRLMAATTEATKIPEGAEPRARTGQAIEPAHPGGAVPASAPAAPSGPRLLRADAPCCMATLDELGRYCIGDCGPACLRRAARRSA